MDWKDEGAEGHTMDEGGSTKNYCYYFFVLFLHFILFLSSNHIKIQKQLGRGVRKQTFLGTNRINGNEILGIGLDRDRPDLGLDLGEHLSKTSTNSQILLTAES